MISVLQYFQQVIHFEIISQDSSFTFKINCEQLDMMYFPLNRKYFKTLLYNKTKQNHTCSALLNKKSKRLEDSNFYLIYHILVINFLLRTITCLNLRHHFLIINDLEHGFLKFLASKSIQQYRNDIVSIDKVEKVYM